MELTVAIKELNIIKIFRQYADAVITGEKKFKDFTHYCAVVIVGDNVLTEEKSHLLRILGLKKGEAYLKTGHGIAFLTEISGNKSGELPIAFSLMTKKRILFTEILTQVPVIGIEYFKG